MWQHDSHAFEQPQQHGSHRSTDKDLLGDGAGVKPKRCRDNVKGHSKKHKLTEYTKYLKTKIMADLAR